MQLIEQYSDLSQAESAANRLRNKGILTHISSKGSYSASRAMTGAFKVGLWAVLDSQYHDACALLINPKHQVTSGLSEEELTQLESQAKEQSVRVFGKLLWRIGFVLLFVIGAIIYVVGNSG